MDLCDIWAILCKNFHYLQTVGSLKGLLCVLCLTLYPSDSSSLSLLLFQILGSHSSHMWMWTMHIDIFNFNFLCSWEFSQHIDLMLFMQFLRNVDLILWVFLTPDEMGNLVMVFCLWGKNCLVWVPGAKGLEMSTAWGQSSNCLSCFFFSSFSFCVKVNSFTSVTYWNNWLLVIGMNQRVCQFLRQKPLNGCS